MKPSGIAFVSDYLHSRTLGTYKSNLALITLQREASFWIANNESTVEHWCVFAHEYAHFLHNFSTIAGLYDFVAHLRLMGLFIRTVDVNGTSHGTDALTERERADFLVWLALKQHLLGDTRPPFDSDYHRRDVRIAVDDITTSQRSLELSTQPDPFLVEDTNIGFSVWSVSTPAERRSVTFGSWHIMEGLAYEIEKSIRKVNGAGQGDAENQVPIYPYKFARIVFEHEARTSLEVEVFGRVCLLALQSSDPGASFIELARVFRKRRLGEADATTLGRVEKVTSSTFSGRARDIITRMLATEFDRFAARGGPVGKAVVSLGEMCFKYVDLRSKNPFFELELFEQALDRERLRHIIEQYPPCPIVHEANMDGAGKEFINLSINALPQGAVDALCVYQTFSQFMFAHLCQTGFHKTSSCSKSRCIFFGACAAPQAIDAPESCQTRPWVAYRPSDSSLCIYAAGVAACRGRADL
jgi:hypothetical protein